MRSEFVFYYFQPRERWGVRPFIKNRIIDFNFQPVKLTFNTAPNFFQITF